MQQSFADSASCVLSVVMLVSDDGIVLVVIFAVTTGVPGDDKDEGSRRIRVLQTPGPALSSSTPLQLCYSNLLQLDFSLDVNRRTNETWTDGRCCQNVDRQTDTHPRERERERERGREESILTGWLNFSNTTHMFLLVPMVHKWKTTLISR